MDKRQQHRTGLSQQEIADIKSVSGTIYMDGVFAGLPPERRTEAVCLAALQADSLNLIAVPERRQSDGLLLNVLRRDGAMIFAIPEERRTPEMYMTALDNCGKALRHFPKEMITPGVAARAVNSDGAALEFVPENIKTPDMCRAALNGKISGDSKDYDLMQHVPFSDVCLEYLQKIERESGDPFLVFGNIKPEPVTPEMARLAVHLEPACIQFVPDRIKTLEIFV